MPADNLCPMFARRLPRRTEKKRTIPVNVAEWFKAAGCEGCYGSQIVSEASKPPALGYREVPALFPFTS